MERKIIAVDFDGTLIRGNSLHEYVFAGVMDAAAHLSVCKLARLACVAACRALRLVPHEAFKRRCAGIIGFPPSVKRRFDKRIGARLRLGLLSALRAHAAEGCEVVIASAAFRFYLEDLDAVKGFALIATDSDAPDCRGDAKRSAVEAYASEIGGVVEAVITDHYDDIPLLRAARRRVLVNPSKETEVRVGAAMPYVIYEDGRDFF